MLNDVQIKKIKDILVPGLTPYFIYIFGSTAADREKGESDVDLAFLAHESVSEYNLFMIGQKVASSLDREVDLIDLNQVSTVMQMEIIYNGSVLYTSDETKRKAFSMKVYKMYAKLNEERQVVLDTIKENGEIHGG